MANFTKHSILWVTEKGVLPIFSHFTKQVAEGSEMRELFVRVIEGGADMESKEIKSFCEP
jgi:hypothetical protein